MKTASDEHGGVDARHQIWIRWWRRCGTAIEKMWDDRDGEIFRKDDNGQGKILTGNDYQPEGVSSIQRLRRGENDGPAWRFGMHLETMCLIL